MRIYLLILTFLIILPTQTLFAQTLAVLDLDRVIEATVEGQKMVAEMKSYLRNVSNELRIRENNLKVELSNLQKNQGIYEKKEYDIRREALLAKLIDISKRKREVLKEFEQGSKEKVTQYARSLRPILKNIAAESNILLIITISERDILTEDSQILYYNEDVDITDRIISLLNKD